MIKYLPLCLMIIAGCALDTESTDDYEVVEAYDRPDNPDWPGWNTSPNHNNGCYGETFDMGDGHVMHIPGLCAPFYIYMGYPDPTEESGNPYDGEQQQQEPSKEQ